MFFGRDEEHELIRAQYSKKSSFSVVYGRRRVGKTRLLVESVKDHPAVYFTATESTLPELLIQLMQLFAEHFQEPLLERTSVASFTEAFEVLETQRKGRSLVLVLDEFQWAVAAAPELPSVLQRFWDHIWKGKGLHLVLCGSYLGFMEREILSSKKPLFGRRTAQLLLKPFRPAEVRAWFKQMSLDAVLPYYFVFGGVPAYLEHIRPERSFRENVTALLLDRGAPLQEEPIFLLREEMRDFRMHVAVLTAISSGQSLAKNIATQTGIPETKLRYYLDPLIELGYIERLVSIEKRHQPTSKKSRYRVSDPLLRFYFRFVHPYQSQLARYGAKAVYDRYIRGAIDGYFGYTFEMLVQTILPDYLQEATGALCEAVGTYWDRNTQIDAVAIRDDGVTHIVECKWQKRKVGVDVVEAVMAKAEAYPNPERNQIVPVVVARSGFTKAAANRDGVMMLSLADLMS